MDSFIENNFFNLNDKVLLPEGKKIINNSGLWLINKDLQQIFLYTSTSLPPRVFSSSLLQLKAPVDEIKSINFIEKDQLYIFAIRNKIPTGFFMKIDEESDVSFNFQDKNKSTNTISFALDSLYFHRQILESFTPAYGSFCIISKEGITLHDLNFQIHFALIHPILFCLFSDNYLYITDGVRFRIYRFDMRICESSDDSINSSSILLNINDDDDSESKTYECCYDTKIISSEILTTRGYPCSFITLSSSLLLVLKNSEKQSIQIQIQNFLPDNQIQKATFDISKELCFPQINQSANQNSEVPYIPYPHIMKYDDCLLTVDISSNGFSCLIDFKENKYTPVGGQFRFPDGIHITGIFNEDFALCDNNCIYKLSPDYSKIKTDSLEDVAAIMRRKDGMNNAFDRLREKLLSISGESDLIELVNKIGPSAADPISQMRFSRLIQFSGISDPHLIIIGLIQFSSILGDKMINEAWVPLFECFAHSQIENLLDSAIRNKIIKLNPASIKNLILAFSKKIKINDTIYSVDNLIDYANTYIDMGLYDDAKIIVILAQLSYSDKPEFENSLDQVKQKLKEMTEK